MTAHKDSWLDVIRQLVVATATLVDTVACWRWGGFGLGLVVIAAGGWATAQYDPAYARARV